MLFRCGQRGLLVAVALALAGALPALATTYTVNSTADTIAADGVITLREAITAAVTNAPAGDAPAGSPGLDTIDFDIPGAGPHTITLTSSLPLITDPVLIDGLSQPGAVSGANPVLQIEITAPSLFVVLKIAGAAASGSTIRGLVVNGYQAFGIQIFESSNNTITTNYIELNPAGTAIAGPPAPGGIGIIVGGNSAPTSGNVIGGSAPGLGNVIAVNGQGFVGIEMGGNGPVDNNAIRGNFVGTDKTGTIALGDTSGSGIILAGATQTIIGGANASPGGSCSGDCNLLSGSGSGITIVGNATDTTTISGNYLGTDVTGTVALPNSSSDIQISDGGGAITGTIMIGGATPATRNLVASSPTGIQDSSAGAHITIQGNYIGTDRSGSQALANGIGITLQGTTAVKIGGVNAGEGNLIAANTSAGLVLFGASGTLIEGNTVGPSVAGTAAPAGAATGNSIGVEIADLSPAQPSLNNQIGAAAPGGAGGNVIAFNDIGVVIFGTSVNNSIFSNSIFSNSDGAVLLTGGSVNDHCDADTGANQLQNFPVLNPVPATGATMTVGGTLDSTGGQAFRIEFFSNPPSGSPQARTPIGSTTVTTDPTTCSAAFSVTLPAVPVNSTITALATDALGNTSQLSAPVAVVLPAIQAAKSFNPSSIRSGGTTTLTITINNPNTITVTGVAFNDTYPAGLVNAANPGGTSNCGGSVTAAPGGNSLAFLGGTIGPSGNCVVSVLVRTTSSSGPSITNVLPAGAVTANNASPTASPASATLTIDVTTIPTISFAGLLALVFALGGVALIALRRTT
jgi:uncharacterized repeat protein (TIGR01451 family)